jgi:mono/diheme cytochrome c family protein
MKGIAALLSLAALAALAVGPLQAGAGSPAPSAAALKNGKAIFLTGHDHSGVKITAATPPLRASCAACHGAFGAGGVHLPGGAVSADLRHAAMSSGKHPYTLALIERAISTGVDNDGEALNRVMPRWKLSQRDLHDVAEYVLTQLR